MEATRQAVLEELLRTLEIEEEMLHTLIGLARRQQAALVESAFTSLGAVNEQMVAVAEGIAPLEAERLALTRKLGVETLSEAAALAREAGFTPFHDLQGRLVTAARAYREIQERNAALVLNAMKLNERWINLVAGMVAPTYAAGGKAEIQPQRSLIRKSA